MQYRHPIPKVCERARTYASLRLDGELSEFERALLESHIAGCGACRAFAADLDALTSELRASAFERLERPLQLPVRVRAGLRRLQVGAAAAVLVTVVGASSLIGSVGRTEQPRFAAANVEPATPTLRELRAADLRPEPEPDLRRGTKLIPV
jgi:predicted anti-sigma-YlaC factor YlaD